MLSYAEPLNILNVFNERLSKYSEYIADISSELFNKLSPLRNLDFYIILFYPYLFRLFEEII